MKIAKGSAELSAVRDKRCSKPGKVWAGRPARCFVEVDELLS